jgi:hypothetical protein
VTAEAARELPLDAIVGPTHRVSALAIDREDSLEPQPNGGTLRCGA